jgi:hypothetical protein
VTQNVEACERLGEHRFNSYGIAVRSGIERVRKINLTAVDLRRQSLFGRVAIKLFKASPTVTGAAICAAGPSLICTLISLIPAPLQSLAASPPDVRKGSAFPVYSLAIPEAAPRA